MKSKRPVTKGIAYGAVLLSLTAFVYVVLLATGTIALPFACLTEERASIPDLSGIAFEITYTNCDTIAKQEVISV